MQLFEPLNLVDAYQYNQLLNHGIGIKDPSTQSHVLPNNHLRLPRAHLFPLKHLGKQEA